MPSSTRGSVLTRRCRCPITVPGHHRTRCGSSVPGTGLRCGVAFLFLRLVPDEVNFRFGWFGWCRRRYVDLWCFLWFLDQDVDQSFLFIGWRECRDVGHSWWRWRRRLNEHYLIMFLWWRRGRQRLAWCVVRGFWRRYVHVYMFMYDGCLCWWSVLWCGSPVATSASASTRGS